MKHVQLAERSLRFAERCGLDSTLRHLHETMRLVQIYGGNPKGNGPLLAWIKPEIANARREARTEFARIRAELPVIAQSVRSGEFMRGAIQSADSEPGVLSVSIAQGIVRGEDGRSYEAVIPYDVVAGKNYVAFFNISTDHPLPWYPATRLKHLVSQGVKWAARFVGAGMAVPAALAIADGFFDGYVAAFASTPFIVEAALRFAENRFPFVHLKVAQRQLNRAERKLDRMLAELDSGLPSQ